MVTEDLFLEFQQISERLHALDFPAADLVVGIATGGTVFAAMVGHQLQLPLRYLHLNYRAPDNTPRHDQPALQANFVPPPPGTRVLLVDDVCVSGSTFAAARTLLACCTVTTVALKGPADIVVFPEIDTCIDLPWRAYV
jgi:adenine/guanine phosphoribosyltransferase-like PRPP-binding protein